MAQPPEPLERPKLARWMWERGLKWADGATALGVSGEQVRRYCLEFGHTQRQLPSREAMERIHAWTNGAITPADFYPPHLNQPAEAQEAAE